MGANASYLQAPALSMPLGNASVCMHVLNSTHTHLDQSFQLNCKVVLKNSWTPNCQTRPKTQQVSSHTVYVCPFELHFSKRMP